MSLNKFNNSSFIIDFLSGGVAGMIGKLIICPIDKIKILLQTQNYINDSKIDISKNKKYNNYKQLINYLSEEIKQKGITSLWVGNKTNIARYITNQAFNFGIKGQIEKIITNKLLCGGITGIFSSIILFPFDLAKVKLITDKDNNYKGFFDCIIKIKKKNGIKGIFNGLGISMLGNFCYRGLYFGLYDIGKKYFFNDYYNNIYARKYLLAQGVSLISESLTYPIDTVRKRRIVNKKGNSTTIDCIKNIYKENNIGGFYNGIFINSFRTIGSSFVLLTFELIKKKLKNKNEINYNRKLNNYYN